MNFIIEGVLLKVLKQYTTKESFCIPIYPHLNLVLRTRSINKYRKGNGLAMLWSYGSFMIFESLKKLVLLFVIEDFIFSSTNAYDSFQD